MGAFAPDGESGLADGLILLAGLMQQYGDTLHPLKANSHKAALEWLAGGRMLDSLARFPEVSRPDAQRIAGALMLLDQQFNQREESIRHRLGALYSALENRLAQSGGAQALVPQNISIQTARYSADTPVLKSIASGRELLEQARVLAKYGRSARWLAGGASFDEKRAARYGQPASSARWRRTYTSGTAQE